MSGDEKQVVVVGGGITGLACAHRLLRSGVDVLLLEASAGTGGKIETVREGGYQFEAGPNTLMCGRPELRQLISELGLEGQMVPSAPSAKQRYIAKHGTLMPLPTRPIELLRSPLLGVRGVMRAAGDLRRSRVSALSPESAAEFVRRRFGARALENLAAPFLTGVYAGDVERLEAASVLRRLVDAERKHGSVIRGMLAEHHAVRAAGKQPKPQSVTFRDGLDSLPRALAEALSGRIRTRAPVASMHESRRGMVIELGTGERIRADHAVLATPAGTTGSLLLHVEGGEGIARDLEQVRLASLAVVGVSFERCDVPHELNGFGYLAGPGASGPVLGCMFRSEMFPHTAPAGMTLLTAFVGGMRFPTAADEPEETLVGAVLEQLDALLGVKAAPERVFVRRWRHAIPQYEIGHAARVDRIQRWCENRRFSVVGSAVTGVSVPDCITAARSAADRIVGLLPRMRRGQLCASA